MQNQVLCRTPDEFLKTAGFNSLMPIEPGDIHKIPQFIHYHRVGGKYVKVACVVAGDIVS